MPALHHARAADATPNARTVADFPAGIVRRYCGCGRLNRCSCGLPRPVSGWTVQRLSWLRFMIAGGESLDNAAFELGQSTQSCNVALNALLGRTPIHALAALERQAKHGLRVVSFDDDAPQALAS